MSQEYSIQVKNLSKKYRLGVIGSGMLSHDINNWWNKVIRPANKKKRKRFRWSKYFSRYLGSPKY